MRLAINGYGRIGRCILRAWFERYSAGEEAVRALELCALNEPASLEAVAYLTRYDSTHGRFSAAVNTIEEPSPTLEVGEHTIAFFNANDIGMVPWGDLDIDLVLECSGQVSSRQASSAHLQSGAKKVLLSNPGESDIQALVYGVNQHAALAAGPVMSAASCTSNALVPVLDVLEKAFGIDHGVVTTIHAAMHDQPVIDAFYSEDLRRNRAASESIIPVATELAAGIGRILPSLEGKFVAQALRVPVINVSALDVTIHFNCAVTEEAVNQTLQDAAVGQLSGVLGYTEEPVASCDFKHDARSAIVDGQQTRISAGKTASILIWFDNEWAYAHRMLDLASYINREC